MKNIIHRFPLALWPSVYLFVMVITISVLAYVGVVSRGEGEIPLVSTGSASNITQTTASLNGTTTPSGVSARGFEYGTDTNYGQTANDNSAFNYTYISKWGSQGTGDGQFGDYYGMGIAVDSSNNVYVADSSNNRIQKFDSSGNFITKWGSQGSGDGQFSDPYDIAIDANGNMYIADLSNNRIQKFDSSGNFITKWGSQGSGDGQFSSSAIAVDSSGNVYVADSSNNRIQKFDSSGNFITKWGSQGSGDGQFLRTDGISIDSSGNIYVADSNNNRIQKFDSSGNFITKWGSYGTSEGQFAQPNDVAADSIGNIYVADSNNNRIQKFDSSGNFIEMYGRGVLNGQMELQTCFSNCTSGINGPDNEQFNTPTSLTVNNLGEIFVWDSFNYAIKKYEKKVNADITNLNCGTTYHYRAFATNTNGIGYGQDQTFLTSACPEPLGIPQNISGTASPKSISLTWDSVTNANFYQIEYKKTNDSNWTQVDGSTIYNPPKTITGLDSETSYDFRIRSATWQPEYSDWSSVYTLSTTAQQTYSITDCAELQGIAINPYTFEIGDPTGNYVLANDIDCSESSTWDWAGLIPFPTTQPIGFVGIMDFSNGQPFTGNLDGNGHTISNLYQNLTEVSMPSGLFAMTNGTEIKDLTLTNGQFFTANSPTENASSSALAYVTQLGSIKNVHINGMNISADNQGIVSGMVGQAYLTTIEDSSVDGNIDIALKDSNSRFDDPKGVAIDVSGNVYVTDSRNNRIQKFDSNGNFITKWGSYGSGNGQFDEPEDIAVGPDGSVYVTNNYGSNVQKFDSNGNFIAKWGAYGANDGEFSYPKGIAVDSSGNIYVADGGNYRIQKFDSNGNFLAKWGSYGSGDNEFYSPQGLEVDSSSNIYVVDAGNYNIKKFDSNGNYLLSWGQQECSNGGQITDGRFCSATHIATDSSGNVYVTDNSNDTVQKFDSNGNFIAKWINTGTCQDYNFSDGSFCGPYGIAIQNNSVYISDTSSDRIQKFNTDGEYIAKWGSYGGLGSGSLVYGGIVGTSYSSATKPTINRSYSNINLNVDIDDITQDAVLGGVFGAGFADINNSYSNGTIQIDGKDSTSSSIQAGGLSGQQMGAISNSYSTIDISIVNTTSETVMLGGLAGALSSYEVASSLTNSFATGTMNGPTTLFPYGSLVGVNVFGGEQRTITNNYFDQTAIGQSTCVGSYVDMGLSPYDPPDNVTCSAVNSSNNQPEYFINNDSNPPLDQWDFTTIWKTNASIPPTFRGAEPPTQTAPGVPRNLSSPSQTKNSISITWQAPSSNGNSAITDYIIQYKQSSSGSWQTFNDGVSTNTTETITGLQQGISYDVRVAAQNVIGTGSYTSPLLVSTDTLPGTPQNLQATANTNTSAILAWEAPASNGGATITDYIIQYKLHSASSWTTFNDGTSTNLSSTVTGLSTNQRYDFRVAAVNDVGQGAYAQISNILIVQPLPSAPQNLTVNPYALGYFALPRLTWDAPLSGAPFTDYVIQYRPQGETNWQTIDDGTNTNASYDYDFGIASADPQTMTPEELATYQQLLTDLVQGAVFEFRVAAVNDIGQGEFTQPVAFQAGMTATDCEMLFDALNSALAFPNANVYLIQNIDCSDTVNWDNGEGWTPVGSIDTPFSGTFDGRQYDISGLIVADIDGYSAGMFGSIENAYIKNLNIFDWNISTLNQTSIYSHASTAGALVAISLDNTHIMNITGNNIKVKARSNVGGLVGYAQVFDNTITVEDVEIDTEVSMDMLNEQIPSMMGGIIGAIKYEDGLSSSVSIVDAKVNTDFKSSDEQIMIGGVVGFAVDEASPSNIGNRQIEINNVQTINGYPNICRNNGFGGLAGGLMIKAIVTNSQSSGDINCKQDIRFDEASALVVDSNDTLIALDYNQTQLRYIDKNSELEYIRSMPLQTVYNNALYVGPDDTVYGITYSTIKKFEKGDASGTTIDINNNNNSCLPSYQSDIAVDSSGNIYVSGEYCLAKYSSDGDYLTSWGSNGTDNGQFGSALQITLDSQSNVYVADIANNRIQKFDSNGNFITTWGSSGVGDGQFNSPAYIASGPNNTIIVADINNDRIQRFTSNGSYINKISTQNECIYNYEESIAVDSSSNIYLACSSNILKYDSSGNLLKNWDNSPINSSLIMAGGLVGYIRQIGQSQIINSSSTTDISIDSSGATNSIVATGGLVGFVSSTDNLNIPLNQIMENNPSDYLTANSVSISDSTAQVQIENKNAKTMLTGGLVGFGVGLDISDVSVDANIDTTSKFIINGFGNSTSTGALVGMAVMSKFDNVSSSGNVSGNGGSLGGLIGTLHAWTEIKNSHSDAILINDDCISSYCVNYMNSNGTGGLIGFAYLYNDFTTSQINNSYFIGSVTTNNFCLGNGGIIGAILGAINISKTHSSGNIVGATSGPATSTGGLIGISNPLPYLGSGTDNLPGLFIVDIQDSYSTGKINMGTKYPVITAYSVYNGGGGLVGANFAALNIERSYSNNDIDAPNASGLVAINFDLYNLGLISNSETPLVSTSSISDSYATGNLNARLFDLSEADDSLYNDLYSQLQSMGGIVGTNLGANINNSYFVGEMNKPTIEPIDLPDNVPDNLQDVFEKMLQFKMGGIVGFSYSADQGFSEIINSFSVPTFKNTNNNSLVGTLTGLTVSMPKIAQLTGGLEPVVEYSEGYKYQNNYVDQHVAQNYSCGRTLEFDIQGNEVTNIELLQLQDSCTKVNQNNSQPNYFINNKTNPPLDKWNFSSIWRTNYNNYPDFVGSTKPGSPNPDNPNNPDNPDNPAEPTNPGEEDNPQEEPATEEVPSSESGNANQPIAFKPLENTVKGSFMSRFIELIRKIPVSVSRAIPYSILALLIAIAAFYGYLTHLESERRKAVRAQTARFKDLMQARSSFVSLTSHYINTPLAKMQGVIELLASGIASSNSTSSGRATIGQASTSYSMTIPEDLIVAAKNQLKRLNIHANQLVVQVQSSTPPKAQVYEMEQKKLSFLTNPAFWLPVSIIALLTIMLNFIFIQADRYSLTIINAGVQLGIFIVGVAALGVSLYYKKQVEKQLKIDSELKNFEQLTLDQQFAFIADAGNNFEDDVNVLEGLQKDIEKYPKTAGFTAGIQELKQLMNQLQNMNNYSKYVPGLHWSVSINTAIQEVNSAVQEYAAQHNVSIKYEVTTNYTVNIENNALNHLLTAPIKNAIEASKPGTNIEVSCKSNTHDKKFVTIKIADHGSGIDSLQLQHIFQPFNQISPVEEFKGSGLGLDLYLARVIALNYGADIAINSQANQGTVVTLTLPLSENVYPTKTV